MAHKLSRAAAVAAPLLLATGIAVVPHADAAVSRPAVITAATDCDGAKVTYPARPGGVLTASDVGLHKPAARAWFARMARLHVTWVHTLHCVSVPASTIPHPHFRGIHADGTIPNWAGYVKTSWSPGAFSTMAWLVHSVSGQSSSSDAVWVGQGGFNGNGYLPQVGTLSKPGASPYAWWEIWPQNSIQKISNLTIHNGDQISASMNTDVDRTADFDICDTFTTKCAYITPKTANKAIGSSVEWIVERITVGGYYTQLSNFGTQEITDASSTITRTVTPADASSYNMTSCSRSQTLATTGAYHTTPYANFHVTWDAAGSHEKTC